MIQTDKGNEGQSLKNGLKGFLERNMESALKIIVGNLLITAAYAFLTVPNHIVNGGVTSFAMVMENFIPVHISVITNIVTVLLLVMSYYFIGRDFLMKSLLSSVCYMGFFSVLNEVGSQIQLPLILPVAVVLASIMVGTGYYLCISAGSSTVGFDVLALAAHKRNPKVNVAIMIRYINYAVLLLGIVAYGVPAIIVGIIFTYLKTSLLNILLKKNAGELDREEGRPEETAAHMEAGSESGKQENKGSANRRIAAGAPERGLCGIGSEKKTPGLAAVKAEVQG